MPRVKTLTTNSIATLLVVLILIGAFVLLWTGGFKGFGGSGGSQSAAAAGAFPPADNFVVLASTYTNSGATTINGDLGYTTGPSVAPTVNGATHVADATYTQGGTDESNMLSALNAQPCDFTFGSPTDLSLLPQPLVPGVYCFTAAASIGTGGITLTGSGTAYTFRIGGALSTVANSIVTLSPGVSPCDVFWTPGAATTLGANSTFAGTDIDDSGITVGNTIGWTGRALSFGGTITGTNDTISAPTCTSGTATLHIIKSVINVSGTATPGNFLVHVKSATSTLDVAGSPLAGTSTPGTLYTLSAGTYNISEDVNPSFPTYHQTFGLDCVGGSVTLVGGQNKICTIINTDIPVPAAAVSSGGGGGPPEPLPLIAITKVPTPLALASGSGVVTYIYTVTNKGTVPMIGVWVKDDTCSPATYISGDTNDNGELDVGEAWVYRCMQTVSKTVTNTATAHGQANGEDAYATALATVVVGASVPPPLITIVKVPSRLTPFPFGGGDVTYTYTVTNPGVVAMHGVVVTDDKCAPVSFISGDVNGNNLLDPGESWTYTCQTHISASTTNTATAKGTANGFTAIDYAFATVLVSLPGLPNTGLPPEKNNAP